MELTDFLGGTYTGRSIAVDSQSTMNFYPEINDPGSKSKLSLIGTPGLRLFVTITGINGNCRGMYATGGDRLFAVVGNKLVEVNKSGTFDVRGTLSTLYGQVVFSENVNLTTNTTQLMLVDGTSGYIFELSTNSFAAIADGDYLVGTHVIYKDSYFIQNVSGTNKFIFSAQYDGTTWDALDYYPAEGSSDNVDAVSKINNEIWLFGSKSIEIWYTTGDSADPFARVNNAFIDIGINAKYSIGTINNTIFWLGSNSQGNNVVWMSNSYIPQRISTHSIEYLIGTFPDNSDAIGYCYQQEGHYFYVLSFQSGNKTLVYDMTTQLWHERGYLNENTGDNDRHLGICQSFWNGKNIIGDYRNGNIYYFDLDCYTDNGNLIKRWRTSPHYHNNRKRLFFKELEIDLERGVGRDNFATGTQTIDTLQIVERDTGIDEHTEGIDQR
jgi:hypothetical protein